MYLDWVLYIQYPVQFEKNKGAIIWALINFSSNANIMIQAHTKQLDLWIWKTNVGIPKIDGSLLRAFMIVIANFQVIDKLGRE